MKTLIKITFYFLIFLAHVYTVYHIHYNAGFMEETILAFTVGFMNSSEYQTYLNYLFDAFYCTLIALYFFSRWSSKEVEADSGDATSSTNSIAPADPEAPGRPTTIARVTEQQPSQQHQEPSQQHNQQKSPRQQQQQKGQNKSKRLGNAKNNKNAKHGSNNNNNHWAAKVPNTTVVNGSAPHITLENGFDLEEAASDAICGVTGSVAGGDLRFSVASLTFFDVICISYVFPLCLLAIYLGWNMQTSIEVSWLSWRWLWGWWTERWTWWRLVGCLLAVVGITVWIKPKKVVGKSE